MDFEGDKAALAGVCTYLDAQSLVNMQLVSKSFKEVATNESLWKHVYMRDFPYYGERLNRQHKGKKDDPVKWSVLYRDRSHRERCWRTGELTRKDPVVLRGHAGTIFGATFLEAPFQSGTIVTGAYLDTSYEGEIKMWLPSRGTTAANAASHVDASTEALDVDAEKEITKSGVLSLYQLHGTPQISCTTFESGVHILRAEEQTIDDDDLLALEDDDWRHDALDKRKRMSRAGGGRSSNSNNFHQPGPSHGEHSCLIGDDGDTMRDTSYSFRSVLEILGQQAPCTKTYVDKNSKILAIPSYDGAVRLYRLPEFISNPSEGDAILRRGNTADTSSESRCPTLEPSAVWMDDEEIEIREHGIVRMEKHMPVSALTMSDDCLTMVTGGNDTRVKIWDMTRETIISRLSGHEGWIWNVKPLDPFVQKIMSTATDGFCKQWDTRMEKCIGTINVSANGPGKVFPVTGVALRGNGWHMAVGSLDKNVYAIDCRMMKKMYIIGSHEDRVCRAMMHEDTLMTTGWDHTVRLWEFS